MIVLEVLSQILPDHTYVTELRIEGDKLRVIGITRDAPCLIRLMEQSPNFTRATFFAPTTRAPSDPGERFHIEAQIEPVFACALMSTASSQARRFVRSLAGGARYVRGRDRCSSHWHGPASPIFSSAARRSPRRADLLAQLEGRKPIDGAQRPPARRRSRPARRSSKGRR